MTRLIEDEAELEAVVEQLEGDSDIPELDPEKELDFSTDECLAGGQIYESIEAEVGPAADLATWEDIPPDDWDGAEDGFGEELPESFYGKL
jgi:hypothetical protein